jgi:uncharacterized protein
MRILNSHSRSRRIMQLVLFPLLWLGVIMPTPATSLHEAAKRGDVERVQQLLDEGAAIDAKGQNDATPLILAALDGHVSVVKTLLSRGADIKARNKGGLTPLHAAAYGGHKKVVELLLAKGANTNDANNRFGVSPLHMAAEENRKSAVELLLANGANVKAKEINGYTPLSRAGFREHWEVVSLLMQHGAVCQPADKVGDWLYQECTKRKIQE